MPFALIGEQCPSGDLPAARNRLVAHFLDNTTIPWLWMVDAGMVFSASTLSDLIEAAAPTARPIVGALCFGLRRDEFDDELQATTFRTFPTLYDFVETDTDAGFAARTDYPEDELVPVGATGAACLVIHRDLLLMIRSKYGDAWFTPVSHPCGRTYSEDLLFCIRVAGVDRPLYVHTGIHTSHDKGGVMLTEAEYRCQQVA